MIGFTKVIAREGARFGITANAIAPGPIETPLLMQAKEFGEIGEKIIENMKAGTQLRRLGQPEEVAAAVAFLGLGRLVLRHRRDASGSAAAWGWSDGARARHGAKRWTSWSRAGC